MRRAKLDPMASIYCKSCKASSDTMWGAFFLKSRRLPSSLMKQKAEGIFHPSLRAEATMAPAGPLTALKGLLAVPTSAMAFFQVQVRAPWLSVPSQTAHAQSMIGSVAMSEPTL